MSCRVKIFMLSGAINTITDVGQSRETLKKYYDDYEKDSFVFTGKKSTTIVNPKFIQMIVIEEEEAS